MEATSIFNQQLFFEQGYERSSKFHVLKFRSVMEKIMKMEGTGSFKNSHSNFIAVLNNLRATELLKNGTDFFWSSVHRLFNALDAGNEMTEIMYGIFFQNAFDAFFDLLPIGSRLEFRNYGDD